MSSRSSARRYGRRGVAGLDGGGPGLLVGAQGPEHDVRQPSAQQPDGLGAGLAPRHQPLDIGLAGSNPADLGDRDHVQGSIDRPVAAAVQAYLAAPVTGPHRDRAVPVKRA
jgi:hypothetical protein